MSINICGWNSFFEEQMLQISDESLNVARVISADTSVFSIINEDGFCEARLSGRFVCFAQEKSDYPVTGDWVLFRACDDMNLIERVFERKTVFQRINAGKTSDRQVIAANIDIMFITNALEGGRDFNERSIERYILSVMDGGAKPVILLNKSDLCTSDQIIQYKGRAKSVAKDINVIALSALSGEGLPELQSYLVGGVTAAFTGPSGVGKSALINAITGNDVQKTGNIRSDDKRGRHTTSSGKLYQLQNGAMIIDTPGLRELRLLADQDSLEEVFPEIAEAAISCKFKDCTHNGEPGCNVMQKIEEGKISLERYNSWLKLKKEIDVTNMMRSEKGRSQKKSRDKALAKIIREHNRSSFK
ncbi:MAG: ribosome small subunit-dependent GTPase A [Spirochaetes bacterium]|nr:ribosome small subunit-dependent GTPase A [Spirochaetota bacterium]MBN2771966.1 ribosome small subunit-dependent GTPase A [Spirochaetota bacterium]